MKAKIPELNTKKNNVNVESTDDKRTLSIYDADNNLLVGSTKDEVIIYAAGMQRENPEILFFEINEIFTIDGGQCYIAVPVKRTHPDQQIKLIPEDVLMDIVAKVKAEKGITDNPSTILN